MPKTGACHLFRHTMATLMLEGGADIRYIQVMLGHAELSTTQIYTQVSVRALQGVHAATHPAANTPTLSGPVPVPFPVSGRSRYQSCLLSWMKKISKKTAPSDGQEQP